MANVREFINQMDDIIQTLGDGTQITSSFKDELKKTNQELHSSKTSVSALQTSLGRNLSGAVEDVVFNGKKLSDAVQGIAKTILDSTYASATKPVSSAFSGIGNNFGTAISSFFSDTPLTPKITPFAKGGVFNTAQAFPMQAGIGVLGEAGPEAILPLSRGSDGKLGVRSQNAGGARVHVTMNISTPDAQSFRQSQSQIAANLSQILKQGNRNL